MFRDNVNGKLFCRFLKFSELEEVTNDTEYSIREQIAFYAFYVFKTWGKGR